MENILVCSCSDRRRSPHLRDEEVAREEHGIHTYPVREPGGALIYGGLGWFVFALRLLALFKKAGIRRIVLESHNDCAWLADHRNSPREKLVLKARRIGSPEEHHNWLLPLAAQRILWFAKKFGFDVEVITRLVDPDHPYDPAQDSILHAARQPLPA